MNIQDIINLHVIGALSEQLWQVRSSHWFFRKSANVSVIEKNQRKITNNSSRGERWYVCVCSVMSNSLKAHGLQHDKLLCPWDFPGKNTGMSWHFLLQGIFLTQELNQSLASPALAGRFFTTHATWEAQRDGSISFKK